MILKGKMKIPFQLGDVTRSTMYYILYYLPALLPFSAYVIYPLVLRTNVLMILDYKNPLTETT